MALKGAGAEIAAAVRGTAVPGAAEQLPLLGADGPVPAAAPRKVGRPKGSRNRRSEELIRWVLAKHQHPLLTLAETYSRPVDELARELACKRSEAKALQVRCAVEALPYFESKKPVSLQVDARTIQLTVGQWEGSGSADLPPWERLAGLIEGETVPPGTNDGTGGDDAGK
jgi:hypothetical protein